MQQTNTITLYSGVPTSEILKGVSATTVETIRSVDLEELYDTLSGIGYSVSEIRSSCGPLLYVALGLHRTDVRAYAILENGKPVYVATLSRIMENGTGILCGYALKHGETALSRRQKYGSMVRLFRCVMTDMRHAGINTAVCHVKATNKPTLEMWQFLKRRFRSVNISVADNPFAPAYKLVTLDVEGGA